MSEENGSGEFNLIESANELIAADSEANAESTQSTQSEGQGESTPAQTEGEKELSPEEILNQVGNEKEEVNPELLNLVNGLNAIHNGLPIKVDSPEQLKELLQKGFDYTKKTMALAEESRIKQEEFSKKEIEFKEKESYFVQKEQEIQNTVFENKIMENLLLKWQTDDPELFNYLASSYQKEIAQHELQKPIISKYENQFKQLNDKFAQLEKGKQQEELGSIKQSWEKDLNETQSKHAASLAKLGVTPDWEKVKASWMADSTNKMTVEQALYAVHGQDIAKANHSYQKLLATKNKTQTKMLNRTGVGNAQKANTTLKAVKAGDYESILREASNQL